MHTHFKWTVVALVIAAPGVAAWRVSDTDLALQPKSRIWVSGTSNVKNFDCNAVKMDVTVATNKPDAVHAVGTGNKAVGTVNVVLPVAQMDCSNGTMNGHMRDALKADDHPTIGFRLESYTLIPAGDSVTVQLTGSLNISGTTKTAIIAAEAKDLGNGVLHVTGVYEMNMKDFGIKPPSLMMGMMKVGEKVQVHFDLLLKS